MSSPHSESCGLGLGSDRGQAVARYVNTTDTRLPHRPASPAPWLRGPVDGHRRWRDWDSPQDGGTIAAPDCSLGLTRFWTGELP